MAGANLSSASGAPEDVWLRCLAATVCGLLFCSLALTSSTNDDLPCQDPRECEIARSQPYPFSDRSQEYGRRWVPFSNSQPFSRIAGGIIGFTSNEVGVYITPQSIPHHFASCLVCRLVFSKTGPILLFHLLPLHRLRLTFLSAVFFQSLKCTNLCLTTCRCSGGSCSSLSTFYDDPKRLNPRSRIDNNFGRTATPLPKNLTRCHMYCTESRVRDWSVGL